MKTDRSRSVAGRTARLSILPLGLLLGCALAASGCVRTPDGTVAVARELDVGRYWRPRPQPPQTPPVQSGTQVFPVGPATGWSRPVSRTPRAVRNSAPARPLACHDEFNGGQRARVVCE